MHKLLIYSFILSSLLTAYTYSMYNEPLIEELTSKSCDAFHIFIYKYFSSPAYTESSQEKKVEVLKKIKSRAKECKDVAKETQKRVQTEAKSLEELEVFRTMSKEDKEYVRQMHRSEQESPWGDPFEVYINRADRKAEKKK